MSEENQTPQAERQTQEAVPGAPAKKKKINKLTLEQLNRKIDEMEKGSHLKSKYYKALVLRKMEFESSSSQ